MIPVLLAAVLVIAMFLLFWYAVIDHENRVYGNIVSCGLGGGIALVLGTSMAAGRIRDYTAGGTYYVVQDAILPWVFGLVGVIALIVAGFMAVDAGMDYFCPEDDTDEDADAALVGGE